MDRHARSKMNTQIYEEACAWFVESRAGDLDDTGRREFDRWLRKSPEHLSAYLEIAAIWNEGPELDPANKWASDALIEQAIKAEDDNVVTLPIASAAESSPERVPATALHPLVSDAASVPTSTDAQSSRARSNTARSWFRGWRRLAIAASVGAVAIAGGTLTMLELSAPIYATALGEQRSIQFADGSTVELNSRSKIRVKYSKQERDVDLLEGQALFHVAHDAGRPFIVAVGATRIRAVGTQFDVYKKSNGTVVTVVEGRVAVYSATQGLLSGTSGSAGTPLPVQALPGSSGANTAPQPPPQASRPRNFSAPSVPGTPLPPAAASALNPLPNSSSFLVSAGEQLTVTSDAAQKTDNPNIAGVTAWREREIVFESASLSDVAEEFNRYNERQLIIADPKLYGFHISGVFSSTDPDSLIRFLKQRPGVKVTEAPSEIRIERNISSEGVTNR
jgi:transmembrane sensor